ncbi:carbohydrate sulfotransferase 8-like [Asterias amurensis]|uniref:carbohydrate sulfotransferase 8-like n=1 Tax=Asterias amurensis TaxID=7602 RepID=UPI003AB626C9
MFLRTRNPRCQFHHILLILCSVLFVVVVYKYKEQSTQVTAIISNENKEDHESVYNRKEEGTQLTMEVAKSTEYSAKEAFVEKQSQVQLQRHKYIQESCAKHPKLTMGGISSTTQRQLLVIDKHKLLYCFIQKAGCTNWKRLLMVMDGNQNRTEDITTGMAHAYFGKSKRKLSSFNTQEQKHRLETYTKFIFTRHPFERVLSSYGNKFANMDVYRKSPLYQQIGRYIMKNFRKNATMRELQTGETITWSEWASYLAKANQALFDLHWKEFYQLCSPCKINYDYIGTLDTVYDDSEYIMSKLDVQTKVSYPPKSVSVPSNSSENIDHYMSQLSKEQIKNLWEVYQLDFELFGYPKPSF